MVSGAADAISSQVALENLWLFRIFKHYLPQRFPLPSLPSSVGPALYYTLPTLYLRGIA